MPEFSYGYALLIGVDENRVPGWALPDVKKDVDALRRVLVDPNRCAYRPDHVKVITGPDATRDQIFDGLAWLGAQLAAAGDNATALVYYSGHGWRDSQAATPTFYLIPYDADRQRIRQRALRADDFAAEIAALNPDRLLVILDCCHAGGMGVKEVASPAPAAGYVPAALPPATFLGGSADNTAVTSPAPTTDPAGAAKGVDDLAQGRGRAVLSSSTGDQKSYVRRDRQMSIFTYHLIEALTGHAQPQAGATEVLVSDVMGHVWRHVPASAHEMWDRAQDPTYTVTGNFPVAMLLGGAGWRKDLSAPDPLTAAAPATGGTAISAEQTGNDNIAIQAGRDVGPVAIDQRHIENTGAYVETMHGGEIIQRDKIVHGDEVHGQKHVGDVVGRDKTTIRDVRDSAVAVGDQAQADRAVDAAELNRALAPLVEAIINSSAPQPQRLEALQQIEALKQEAAQDTVDDGRVATLVNRIAALVPGTVGALVSAFATPILGGISGQVTQIVVDNLKRRQR